ncbi:MAG: SIS domain-containing protein, partial [Euryarchaeota archaeon]|nr:SIS domain-containing protein [Euryarchaeota archaeon]
MVPQASASLGADMLRALSTYVKDYQAAFEAGRAVGLPGLDKIDNVVLTGMGGSGIGASLVAALARDTSPKPITVLKDYHLPAFVGPRTLVIATSYSGNTEETLLTVAEAQERKAAIIGLASGGTLAAFCQKKKHPLYSLPKDRQPRAALPFLFGGLAGM